MHRSLVLGICLTTALLLWSWRGRADAPAGRYTVTDGTVLDTKTRLVWQQTVDLPRNWQAATDYCRTSTLPGTGWRLPSVNELMTLVDATNATNNVIIDQTAFPNTPTAALHYWSLTSPGEDNTRAWTIQFGLGVTVDAGKSVASTVRARCVRSAD
jgi:hypothetical protein